MRDVGDVPRRIAEFAVAAALVCAAGNANAQPFALDTGVPTGSSELVVSTAASYAAEFYLSAGETVTDLAAYLSPSAGNGNTFTFDIFSGGSSFISSRSPTVVYSESATVTATSSSPGWDSVAASWTPTTSGYYWIAVLEPTTGTTLDAQSLASAGTGTVPAQEFAYTNTPGSRYAALTSATGIGFEVTATPVPLPSSVWLLLSALSGFMVLFAGTSQGQRAAA
jgi:hypothetical protein